MIIEARVSNRGVMVPAFQIDECFAEEVGKRKWSLNEGGYLRGWVDGRGALLARYLWLLHTGDWPRLDIDHINRDKLDNRISNLREVSRSENLKNQTPLHRLGQRYKKNSNLPTGVHRQPACRLRPYCAQVDVKGKRKYLGCFATPEEASARYQREVAAMRAALSES